MSTLLLVDGSSYLYRAYHALPDLRTSRGEPTGAVRGVLAMLRRLSDEYRTSYRACVFDAKGKTFRDDWYPAYKANRPSMPEDLQQQIEPLHQAIAAEGWPILSVSGVEADDVIATLTRQAREAGLEVVISTGDKDLTQLVRPGVLWVNTMSNEVLDEAGVEAKFGVPPQRIVDYLTLVGDNIDNVPGVEKCGPKTAVKWLQVYGTLDNLVRHADEISGKVGENLRRHLEFLPLGKRLVTVLSDVELPLQIEDLVARDSDPAVLQQLYERLEFKGWLRDLAEPQTATPKVGRTAAESVAMAPPGVHRSGYELVLEWADFERWLARIESADLTAFDTETTSLEPMNARLVGMSFALQAGEAAYLPLGHRAPGVAIQLSMEAVLERLRSWLESPHHRKIGQNLKYDAHVLRNHGIRLAGVAEDTLLQSYVLESDRPHDLDSLARRHLGIATITYTELCGKGAKQIGFADVDLECARDYAAEDADICLRLQRHFSPILCEHEALEQVYRNIELPVSQVLLEMERTGVLIDAFALAQQSVSLGQRLHQLEQQAHQLAGQSFNLGSPKQLGEILFGKLGLPILKKTTTGQPSTDEEVLQRLAEDYPLPKLLLEHRGLAKLKSTYSDKLPRMVNPSSGRVHTSFSQATAVTGRLASSEPNLQNIPIRSEEGRRIRAAFIAPPAHVIVSADYSQIELRIMAHLSADERLLAAFAANEDVHRATAAEVFCVAPGEVSNEQRRYAKVINFGLIYGMSAHGLAKNLGIDRSAAQRWIDRYFQRYPGVADYMERIKQQARTQGYVETVFGRRLYLPDLQSRQATRRQGAERAAINAPMQGTAADLIKLAMIATQRWLEQSASASRLILQVHDELVLEVPEAEKDSLCAALPPLMENVASLTVPLRVDVGCGQNWQQAH